MPDPLQSGESGSGSSRIDQKTTFSSTAALGSPAVTQRLAGKERTHADRESKTRIASEGLQGLRSIDPSGSVLLRFECLSSKELKVGYTTSPYATKLLPRYRSSDASKAGLQQRHTVVTI
jgi:hypothetical protein